MPRLVIKNLKLRKPPAERASKVVLRKPPRVPNFSDTIPKGTFPTLADYKARVANVIKVPPKPIAQRAAEKGPDIKNRIASRNRYRENAGVVMDSCLDNLAQLEDIATKLTVTLPDQRVREIDGFTVTGLGGPLKTSGATITRWLKRGMIPEPFLETSRGAVYHIEEARVMVRLIGNHQHEFRQYRDDHEELKDQLFKAIFGLRRGLFPTK